MSKKNKMVFCTQNMAPFRMRWVDELAIYVDVVVYHLNEYGSNVNMKYINYTPKRARVLCKKKKIVNKNFYDVKEIIEEKADIYLLDGYGFIGQLHLMWELSKRHIPFLISVDGGFINEKELFLKKIVKRFFMAMPQAYLSTSKETDSYIRYYAGNDARIVRHFFSSVSIKDVREKNDIESKNKYREELLIKNKFTIIAVGQFIPRKGFDILIEALKMIEADIQVYFVGASNTKLYNSLIDEKIKDKICFVNFCNEKTLREYYIASDVFVLPTREDIWGLVIGEAMAQGLPVITTDKCLAGMAMIEEEKNGFIIPAENPKKLAEKILYLYSKPALCEEIGKNNLKLIKKYSIEEATKVDVENLREWGKRE